MGPYKLCKPVKKVYEETERKDCGVDTRENRKESQELVKNETRKFQSRGILRES